MPNHRTDALRVRLAVIVAVASGLVALGVTGAGLLGAADEPTPLLRVLGAVAAIGAGGVLLRLDGPARATTSLVTAATVALGVCLFTLPASPVTAPWNNATDPPSRTEAPDGGPGAGVDLEIEPGAPGRGALPRGALSIPPGADVVVEGGRVLLALPDGSRITIGGASTDGAAPAIGSAGAGVIVVDGVATRDDGGALGADIALGGTTIERGDGSQVSVGDGMLLDVPSPLESDVDDPTDGLDALLAVLLGCFALLAFAPPFIRFSDRVGVTLLESADGADDPAPVPVTVEQGLADVLRSMLADDDPRTSVIGAYARLLTALAESGFPRRDEEGPHEHLWRSLGPLGVRRQPVHQLAELFVRARFTPRPVTDDDRQSAITALADAVGDLRLQASDVREAAESIREPAVASGARS